MWSRTAITSHAHQQVGCHEFRIPREYYRLKFRVTMTSSVPAYLNSLILHGVNPTGKEIGRGAYGRVFEVDYEETLCAAKEVHALLLQYSQGGDLQKIKDDFLSECQIWSTLRHPCVVQFLGSVIVV